MLAEHQFENLYQCKEMPSGEEPVGKFVTFRDLLPTIMVISDKNQTKTESSLMLQVIPRT